jgi:hypothetical protein
VLPLDREVFRPRGSPERGYGADRHVENVVRDAIDLEDQKAVSLQSSMEELGIARIDSSIRMWRQGSRHT